MRELLAGAAALAGQGAPAPDGRPDAPLDEVFAALRAGLRRVAGDGPAVVVLEDLHWAEPALLDLVERIWADPSSGALLLVATARPELLDRRPDWADVAARTTLPLGPLAPADAAALAAASPAAAQVGEEALARATAAGGGNPLFVEQMVALLAERPDVTTLRPPSVEALLSARIDQLPGDERHVAERAAIVGDVFGRHAVAALIDDAPGASLDACLERLARRGLVRLAPDDAGDAAFTHALVRDAAYDRVPKADRATLHERHGDWLEARGAELVQHLAA